MARTAAQAHVGDIGTVFFAYIIDQDGAIVDISHAASITMLFERPDGSAFSRTASFITSGVDGGMEYTTISGDLDVPGNWNVQAYVVFSPNRWHALLTAFIVGRILTATP